MLEAGLSKGRRDGFFWAVLLSTATIRAITWLAIFEHNYHPRIYRLNEDLPERSVSGGKVAEGGSDS